ncbi:hypothetical protein ACET3Z_010407 [Daucus carota]
MRDGFGTALPNRDDFGLPKWGFGKSSEESKPSAETKSKAQDVPHVFDEMSKKEPPNPFVDKMKGKLGEEVPQVQNGGKSWANVLKKESPAQTKFDYFPLEKDAISVEPPLETLKKGNDKFKCCVVGACPRVNRVWVKKDPVNAGKSSGNEPVAPHNVEPSSVVLNRAPVAASVQGVTNTANEETWTEVKRKKDLLNVQEASPSPPQTFRNLKNVDEIDKRKGAPGGSNSRLTKSQKRKLRLKQGTESPNHS